MNTTQIQLSNIVVVEKQCRICLETSAQSNQQLIAPCNCRGSVQYMHKKCLLKWIQTYISRHEPNSQDGNIYSINCEMCSQKLKFQLLKQIKCNTIGEIAKLFKERPCFYTIYLIILSCILGMIIFLAYWYSQKQNLSKQTKKAGQTVPQQWMWITLIVLIVILAIAAIKIIFDILVQIILRFDYQALDIVLDNHAKYAQQNRQLQRNQQQQEQEIPKIVEIPRINENFRSMQNDVQIQPQQQRPVGDRLNNLQPQLD